MLSFPCVLALTKGLLDNGLNNDFISVTGREV
jgi:hypothetical protein